MAWQYCIELDGETICIPIPVKINDRPWEPPWWDVLARLLDTESDPWVHDGRLDGVVMRNLSVLAAIDALSEGLSLNVRRQVRENLTAIAEQIDLPDGRTLVVR